MVTLEIQGEQLNTSDDFTVQLEDQNPATVFDKIPGNKAIGIDIPVNDTNRRALDNPERFEKMGNINDRKFEGAALKHFGQPIQRGTLIIDETTAKNYGGWLRDIVGNLAEQVANRYINQTTLGGEQTFANKASYNPDVDDYACPKIFNRHFWRDRGARAPQEVTGIDLEGNEFTTKQEEGRLTSQFFENEQFFVNFPEAGGVRTGGQDVAVVVSPMLFLWKAVELILSDNLIFVKENFLKDHADLKKLILYHNYNIVLQGITTTEKLITPNEYWEDIADQILTQEITYVIDTTDKFFYKNLIPKLQLGKLVLGIQNYLNVIFSFNDLGECRIVDRQKLLTDAPFDLDEYMIGEWELGERKDVAVKLSMNHDPQDYAFSDNYEDLSDLRQYIKEPVQQRADLDALEPEMDEIRKVLSENRYYKYHWHVITSVNATGDEEDKDVLDWEKRSIGFQPYYYNDGDKEVEEIETCFSTCRQSENGYPLVMQKGNSEAFKTQAEAFTPRLLFYEGDEVASNRTNNISLDFDGETGLAATRWNYWLPFWANRLPARATFKFPASIYFYIKNNMHVVPFRTRHGSFIIDKIEAVAGKADTITAKVDVYKRESVVGYTSGTVPGGGDGTTTSFEPQFVGVTATGKPYLVNSMGEVRIPPGWGTLSPAQYAPTSCIAFDPASKQLFVGGYNGMLYISDLSDVDNLQMKGIKVFSSGNVAAVGFVNGTILVAKDASDNIYQQPFHAALADYADNEATLTGNFPHSGTVKGFAYADGYYLACTWNGENIRSADLNGWDEVQDRDAHFTCMCVTESYLWTFDYDDRNFWADRTNPTSWSEFDIEANDEPEIIEAIPFPGDKVLVITKDAYEGARLIIDRANRDNLFTPPLAKYCGGACALGGAQPAIGIKEDSGTTRIATYSEVQSKWNYISVPAFFEKLFSY